MSPTPLPGDWSAIDSFTSCCAVSKDGFSKAGIYQTALNPQLCQESTFALKVLQWIVHAYSFWRELEGFLGDGLLQDYHLSVCSASSSLLQWQLFWDSFSQRIRTLKNRKHGTFFLYPFIKLFIFSVPGVERWVQTALPYLRKTGQMHSRDYE